MELIICEQMNKYRVRLKDISSLEFAENKAKCRLTLIRRSMVSSSNRCAVVKFSAAAAAAAAQVLKTAKRGHEMYHSAYFSLPGSSLVKFSQMWL